MVADAVQEIAVVADDNQTAVVVDQRLFQNAQCDEVQIVGRLVENQEVSAALEDFRESQTRPFAARKLLDLRVDPLVFKHEALEIAPDGNPFIAEIDELVPLPDLFADRAFRIERDTRLVDVIEFNSRSNEDFARIRLQLLRHKFEKRRFPRAVRSDHTDFMRCGELKRKVTQNRPSPTRKSDIFHIDDLVAEVRRFRNNQLNLSGADGCVLRGDFIIAFQASEIAAQTRLRRAADPFDFAAQKTAPPRLRLVFGIFALLFRGKKVGIRTFAGEKFAVVKLNDAGCDAVEKVAVVSDEQARPAVTGKELFDSGNRLHIEVVGRLVEQQQIRLADDGSSQHDTAEFASGKLRAETVQVGDMKFCKRDFQFLLRMPCVMKSQQMFERLVFRRLRRKCFVAFEKRIEPGEPLANRLLDGEPFRRSKILRHIGDADSARNADVAARRLFQSRDDFQQG